VALKQSGYSKFYKVPVSKSASLQMAVGLKRICLVKDHLQGVRVGIKNWPALSVAVQAI